MRYRFIDEGKQHLHTLDGKPLIGTTTCTDSVFKFSNLYWASGMACAIFGWLNPKYNPLESLKSRATEVLEQIKTLDTEAYLALLDKAYKAHSEKKEISAEAGTTMHDTLETYINYCLRKGGVPHMETFEDERINKWVKWAVANVEEFLFTECYCYSEVMWMGGKFDLIFRGKDGKNYIGDFKSAKESYHKNWIQMAFYEKQVMENGILDKEGNKLAEAPKIDGYALFPMGGKVEPDFRFNTLDYWKAAEGVLVNYKLMEHDVKKTSNKKVITV